jgi:hypothetical protein
MGKGLGMAYEKIHKKASRAYKEKLAQLRVE